jgi:hypothetical protein
VVVDCFVEVFVREDYYGVVFRVDGFFFLVFFGKGWWEGYEKEKG